MSRPLSTKDIVLQELVRAHDRGGYVSGESIAKRFNISRVSIWKAVRSLIKSGLDIESKKNKGYRLSNADKTLDSNIIEDLFNDNLKGADSRIINSKIAVCVFKTIDSTNEEAKRRCAKAGHLRDAFGNLTEAGAKLHCSVIVSEEQTSGRGRMGRVFYSPAVSGVYMSIIYSPKESITKPSSMTAAAAVAVCRALKELYNVHPQIKWVNDVFINGKKVCGILTEGTANFETGAIETAIVGIGVNITDGENGFPAEIKNTAGSVLGKTNDRESKVTRNMLVSKIIEHVISIYDSKEHIIDEYRRLSFVIGKTVTVKPLSGGIAYQATVRDIDNEARLVIETKPGVQTALQSDEISLCIDECPFMPEI